MPSRSSPRMVTRGHRHRSTASMSKIPVYINCYDLLPPSFFVNLGYRLGTQTLRNNTILHKGLGIWHTGLEIDGREYAFGGHDLPGTGVFKTKPRTPPPGTYYRATILHGFTFATKEDIQKLVSSVSEDFPGRSYNLLTRNCVHFTSALAQRLCSKPTPGWMNFAARLGSAIPCVVPSWILPDFASDDEAENEREAMIRQLPPSELAPMQPVQDGRSAEV
ncbi:DeSI-like protein sdu1 [Neolecta irregularis DAH-3]|uniref:DeSI-like protein sdu1 n=1 Tax=Neolecta irregularis (strain DAH-3) TaxID=1198029 RepID=A0A1U7LIV4_NEOID|nr:DeSI-like protein sdu1 [Neolecta irregularis DAH-3]|eukprot:OLL22558.1 DeSI-like protein sdu1 [Neolecta irregularis DAH-3]